MVSRCSHARLLRYTHVDAAEGMALGGQGAGLNAVGAEEEGDESEGEDAEELATDNHC